MDWANLKKTAIHLWHLYATPSNVVLAVALVIAASWVWGTISTLQTNFAAQKAYEEQVRQLQLTELEVATLEYQRNYYASEEYKDLAARTYLGLASPGEKVLMLPPNSDKAKGEGSDQGGSTSASTGPALSNFRQWLDFLSGKNAQNLQG